MIIYPDAYVLTAQDDTGYPLINARIGWQTHTRADDASATASTEEADGPSDAPLRPDTAEYWQPTTMPATWTCDFGEALDVDYIGIAGHDIGSSATAVEVAVSTDGDFDAHVTLPGTSGNYISTPDSAAVSITGDLELRVLITATDYTPATAQDLLSKTLTDASAFSYRLWMHTDGKLKLAWTADGTTVLTRTSTAASSVTDATKTAFKATLDVNNGAAGHDVKFWKAADWNPAADTGTWVQIGSTVTTAGTTSIHDSAQAVKLGTRTAGGAGEHLVGTLYYAEVRSGIGGTVVAAFDPSRALTDATTVVAATGETWTIAQAAPTAAALVNPLFSEGTAPANDAPLLFMDDARSARFVRVKVTGSAAPKIAVVYAGEILVMQKAVSGPYEPVTLARETKRTSTFSRGGQFLGQSIQRMGVVGTAAFKFLSASWVREFFKPFADSAELYPFFFAWNPSGFPTEVAYAWCEDDIRPRYTGTVDDMEVAISMHGIAGE